MGLADQISDKLGVKFVKTEQIKKTNSTARNLKRQTNTQSKTIAKLKAEHKTALSNLNEYRSLFPDPIASRVVAAAQQGKSFKKTTPIPKMDLLPMGVWGIMGEGGIIHPVEIWPWQYVQFLSKQSEIVRLSMQKLKQEIFRQGHEWEGAYTKKCPQCETEFDYEIDDCDVCGYLTLEPDEIIKDQQEEEFKKKNPYGKDFMEVCEQIEDDWNGLDNGYLIAIKDYYWNEMNALIGSKVRYFVRGDPVLMRPVVDKNGLLGGYWWVCPEHRSSLKTEEGTCHECGRELKEVMYVSLESHGKSNIPHQAFIEGEVLHLQKYSSNPYFGDPPITTLIFQILSLQGMDKYIYDFYNNQRYPKAIGFVPTNNQASLKKWWKEMVARAEENPHFMPMLGYQTGDEKGAPQILKLADSLTEMQYTESRDQLRSLIASQWGIMPLFTGDLSTSGGLNQEGLQITVSNRAIEYAHSIYNNKLFPWVLAQYNNTVWKLKMVPSEEQDKAADVQLEILKAQHAQLMVQMGFEAELGPEGEFTFSGEAKQMPEQGFGAGVPGLTAPSLPTQSFGGQPESPGKTQKASPVKELKTDSKEFTSELEKELNKVAKEFDYKRRPTKLEIRFKVDKAVEKLSKRALNISRKQLDKIYRESMDRISSEVGTRVVFGDIDKITLDDIQKSKVFVDAYDGLSKDLSARLNKTITDIYKKKGGFTAEDLSTQMKEVIDLSDAQLERIARTETQHVTNISSKISYEKADPEGEYKYKWSGPSDNRTTPICEAIKSRTVDGVSLSELKAIVEEESRKGKAEPRDFTPHINCRHRFIRVV